MELIAIRAWWGWQCLQTLHAGQMDWPPCKVFQNCQPRQLTVVICCSRRNPARVKDRHEARQLRQRYELARYALHQAAGYHTCAPAWSCCPAGSSFLQCWVHSLGAHAQTQACHAQGYCAEGECDLSHALASVENTNTLCDNTSVYITLLGSVKRMFFVR